MFSISKIPLENLELKKGLLTISDGALATFEGLVRNKNGDKDVAALEYEIFDELAQKEGNAIVQEAKEKFKITDARCFHRSGRLKVGEMAVWVGVVAGHRTEAFKACQYIIDELKMRLPVWKKEYYKNGDLGWIDNKGCHKKAPEQSEQEYYSRQIVLPQVGKVGQEKLKSSKILIVGAGGLGSPAAMYLAAAGIGTIGICECDTLEASNLHRQTLYAHADVGRPKDQLAVKRLKEINPFIGLKTHAVKLTAENVESIISGYDLLLDCTDNFPAKFLLNDVAVLNRKPLIQASVDRFEGQMLVYRPDKNSSCLRCLWPQIPNEQCAGSCVINGIVGVVPGVFGILQAVETIKLILNLPGALDCEMLIFDLLSYRTKRIRLQKDLACPVCGNRPTIKDISTENYSHQKSEPAEVDLEALPIEDFLKCEIVDIREPQERMVKPIRSFPCLELPLSKLDKLNYSFDRQKKYLFFCEKGRRSDYLTQQLRNQGFKDVFSIKGGADVLNAYLKKHHHVSSPSKQ